MALRLVQGQALKDLLRQAGEMGVGGSVLRLFQSSRDTVGPLEAEHLGQFAERGELCCRARSTTMDRAA
jgi:hypothetical protein